MKDLAKRRPSPSLVISCLALFVALSGSAVALQGRNSVTSDDLRRFSVKRTDLAPNSVAGGKVVNNSLTGGDINESTLAFPGGGPQPPTGPAGGDLTGNYPDPQIADNAVDSAAVALDSLTAADLAANSVGSSEIAAAAVAASELATNAVPADGAGTDGSTKLATNSVDFLEIDNNAVRSQTILDANVVAADLGPIVVRTGTTNVANGGSDFATANCQADEQVLGGGTFWNFLGNGVYTNYGHIQGNGFQARGNNFSGAARVFTAEAYCLDN